jgi:hypothetical protein
MSDDNKIVTGYDAVVEHTPVVCFPPVVSFVHKNTRNLGFSFTHNPSSFQGSCLHDLEKHHTRAFQRFFGLSPLRFYAHASDVTLLLVRPTILLASRSGTKNIFTASQIANQPSLAPWVVSASAVVKVQHSARFTLKAPVRASISL